MKISKAVALASAFSLGIAVSLLSLVALLEDGKKNEESSERFSTLRLGHMFGRNNSNIAIIAPVAKQISTTPTKLEDGFQTAPDSILNAATDSTLDIAKPALDSVLPSNVRSEPPAKISPAVPAVIESSVPKSKAEVQVFSSSISRSSANSKSCNKTFVAKCEMYPYVKFWNQVMSEEDCYQSPLRHPLGPKGTPEELKYVVFMPDGGGWNNIRMAAETAMLFAHATGR